MSFFVCSIIVAVLMLLLTAVIITSRVKRELRRYNKCVSVGTVLLGVVMVAASVTPIVNIVALFITGFILLLEYQDEVEDFLREPVCFWRKEK